MTFDSSLLLNICLKKYYASSSTKSRSVRRLDERFLETGSVGYKKQERNKTITDEENQLVVVLTAVFVHATGFE